MKYKLVPAIVSTGNTCFGCVGFRGPVETCESLRKEGGLCTAPERIFIEDTPEALAAYVAAKLEN